MHTLSPAPITEFSSVSSQSSVTPSRRPNSSFFVWRLLPLLGCVAQTYTSRHSMNPDGLAYLDVATAYLQGDWTSAINSYWSPLYSWLLAAVLGIVRPVPYWEATVVHVVNLGLALLAIVALETLLRELLQRRIEEREWLRERWHDLLPDWLLVGLSYTLFTMVLLRLVTVGAVTPDLLVLSGVLFASTLLLRLARRLSVVTAGCLGVVLGLSYLAKAVMFPLAWVYLGLVGLLTIRRGLRPLAYAVAGFVALAGPWVLVLSLARGEPTFGDSGRLNYLWYVNQVPHPNQLAGMAPPLTPAHPRALSRVPLLTWCGSSAGETCPLWFDPSRYYAGIRPRLEAGQQLKASTRVLGYYHSLFAEQLFGWTLTTAALVGLGIATHRGGWFSWSRQFLNSAWDYSPLLVPALAGLMLYLLVGHAESRLAGPFVVPLFVGLLATVRLPHPRQMQVRPIGVSLLGCLVVLVGLHTLQDISQAARASSVGESREAHPHYQVASSLRRLGLEPGDEVASIGLTYNAYWARLGGFTVLAELSHKEALRLWSASPTERTRLWTACRLAGARAVVCNVLPEGIEGWRRVSGTSFAVLRFHDAVAPIESSSMEKLDRMFPCKE